MKLLISFSLFFIFNVFYSCSNIIGNKSEEGDTVIAKKVVYIDTNQYVSDINQKFYDSLKAHVDDSSSKVQYSIATAQDRLNQKNLEFDQRLIKEQEERQRHADSIRLAREQKENRPITCYVSRREIILTEKLFNLLYKKLKPIPCSYGILCANCLGTGWAPDNVLAIKLGNVHCVYRCDACYGVGYICQ